MTDQHKRLFLENRSLVDIIAHKMYKRLAYKIEYDDLLQYAYLGLIDAIERFKAGSGASFETYASIRIRGFILDELRKIDPIGRYLREQIEANVHEPISTCSYEDCHVGVPCRVSVDKLDLENAINKLSLIERQIIYYHYIQGFPLKRMGSKVGKKYVEIVEIHDAAISKLRTLIA